MLAGESATTLRSAGRPLTAPSESMHGSSTANSRRPDGRINTSVSRS